MDRFEAQITFLSAEDLTRSAAFYGDLLALPLVRDQGDCLIYQVAGDAYLGVCDHRSPPEDTRPDERDRADRTIVTLVADDVDGWARRLTAAGVSVEGPTFSERFGIYHLFVRDPDDHLVEIQRFQQPL